MNRLIVLISAAIAGTLAGWLSAVPVVIYFNFLLFGWLWAHESPACSAPSPGRGQKLFLRN